MMNSQIAVASLSSSDLLSDTRELVRKSHWIEAQLLVYLGEIDERKLYLEWSFSSMFAFCVAELNFSEDVACNRINVARVARRVPGVLEALRAGRVHLAGLRVLARYLTPENHAEVLAEATGKSKSRIEELVARRWPQPDAPTVVRKLPAQRDSAPEAPTFMFAAAAPAPTAESSAPVAAQAAQPPASHPPERRAVVAPLSEDTFKFQFTASRACRDKLRQAQDLLRHRVPAGEVGTIVEKALDALIEKVMKERFAQGCKARRKQAVANAGPHSRHVPASIKREVFERDGGRCTYTDERGRRCAETSALEFDHVEGFARTRLHEVDGMRLLCRAHNQYAAEQMYGRAVMERARGSGGERAATASRTPSG